MGGPAVRFDEGAITFRLAPSGITWAPFRPDPTKILIEDVARSLALTCRFGGMLGDFYSVAQHSVLVSHLVAPGFELAGLLHDLAEALSGLGDVVGPVKNHPFVAAIVKPIEQAIEDAAAERFGLPVGFSTLPAVREADQLALRIEDHDLRGLGGSVDMFAPTPITPWPWQRAERAFLSRFRELGGK